eukprot:Tamp_25809.p1 GENE.Tamp_25809~~Tamp_25809.p1  ORF type:complete len:170 (+),score=33.97 Tamp_25809:154-663(+)
MSRQDRTVSFDDRSEDSSGDASGNIVSKTIQGITSFFDPSSREPDLKHEELQKPERRTAEEKRKLREKQAAIREKETQITATLHAETTDETRHVIICQSDSYQDFLDHIVNEFGVLYWPVITNPLGGFLVVDSDEMFDFICTEAERQGNRIDLEVVDKLPNQANDSDSD